MRVPDDAMRKAIGCPQCGDRLRVPVVEIGAAPVAVEVVAPAPAAQAAGSALDFLDAPPSSVADIPASSTSTTIRTSRGSRKRRRGGSTPWGLWLFLAALAAAMGGAWVFLGGNSSALTGSLVATASGGGPQSGTVAYPESLPAASREAITRELSDRPLRFSTSSVAIEVTGTPTGLAFTVEPSEGTRVVQVDPAAAPPLAAYLTRSAASLNAARQTERSAAIEKMFGEMTLSDDGSIRPGAAAAYRDSVFLATLQDGLGGSVIANVAGTGVPVMAETNGKLLFALDPNVTLFELVERVGIDRLPDEFRYRVEVR